MNFHKMPRGSYRAKYHGHEIDVWQVRGQGWRFTILDVSAKDYGIYVGSGVCPSLESAQAAAAAESNRLVLRRADH